MKDANIGSRHVLTDILTELAWQLATLVILATWDKVRQEVTFLRFESLEQQVLAVDAESLGCGRHGDDFQVGELADDTSTRNIPEFINAISSKFLVYVDDFCENYDEVVFEHRNSNHCLNNLLIIC